MSIDEIEPRQLAPSVGTGDADCAIVTVPYGAIYNSSAMENHILFGTFDFTAHSPATLRDFESIGDGLEMLFGSFLPGGADRHPPPPRVGAATIHQARFMGPTH